VHEDDVEEAAEAQGAHVAEDMLALRVLGSAQLEHLG
jgi:hypothetical protein